jgi:acetolactate synthase-1/2/3 large subunit
MHGFQALPELLRRNGSTTVFGVLGNSNVAWIGEGVRTGTLRLVKTRHEDTSVGAAAAFSRVTGGLGVCSATRGPGFANCINPLISAVYYHAPLLLVVGESPSTTDTTWQNIDQRGFSATIGAGFHHVATVDELEAGFWAAVDAASFDGRPQVLSIGDGVLEAEIILGDAQHVSPSPPPAPPAQRIQAAVDALESARRPLILAGQGALLAGCQPELERFADLIGARVGTTINVNRFFSGHPHDVGLVGQSAAAPIKALVRETDVVLAVGASLNSRTMDGGRLFAKARMIQCDIDPTREGIAAAEGLASNDWTFLCGDGRTTVTALIDEWHRRGLGKRPVEGKTPSYGDVADAIVAADVGQDPERGIDLRALYREVSRRLPSDRIVVTDAGRSRATMAALVDARDARSWLDSHGYGSIGLGLGYAIGAAAAAPRRRVVLFTGDVGFMMASHDLDAVRLNDLDLTIVIRNDQQFGAEIKYLAAFGLPPDIARQDLPDVAALARAFGGNAVVIDDIAGLLDEHLTQAGLFIIDARIDPDIEWRVCMDAATLPT